MNKLKDILKEKAFELGFVKFGVAEAVATTTQFGQFADWLDAGYSADMDWIRRAPEKRKDVRNLLPGAKSVIVVAYNYFSERNQENIEHDKYGKLSCYAWGDDYHDVVMPKLRQLAGVIKGYNPDSKSKCFNDSGLVMEKRWAEMAGIGWQGKHSLIITKQHGSWVFLGVVVTTEPIEPDEPAVDICGECTICVDKCPTKAIIKPKVVDANRCISYWTIEAGAELEIPDEISNNLSGCLFGCDICQQVCPWNIGNQEPTQDERLLPRNGETSLNLNNILSMTQDEFAARFKGSTIKRSKLTKLQRNAISLSDGE